MCKYSWFGAFLLLIHEPLYRPAARSGSTFVKTMSSEARQMVHSSICLSIVSDESSEDIGGLSQKIK